MTLVGVLMGTVYGVIALNSLAMFLGVFFLGFRVCSIYCTFIACLFHAAVIVVTPILLFTKYNAVCARSLFKTYDGFRWTMFDDFETTFSLWIASFFVMFGFLFCGLQSAYSRQQSHTIGNKF